jgi:hypothetical protein
MGRREILHTVSLLARIEGHFTHEFLIYVYETQDRSKSAISSIQMLSTVALSCNPRTFPWPK